MKLNNNAPMPMYLQLADYLSQKIKDGVYAVGDKLPSESSLCKEFTISRITVRQALNLLMQQDLVYSVQGKGVFVKPKAIRQKLNEIVRFSSVLHEKGLQGHTKILSFSNLIKHTEAENLLGEEISVLNLIGYAEETPIVCYRSYFSKEMGKKMHQTAQEMSAQKIAFSTYDLYSLLQIKIHHIEQTISAINADNELCETMKLPKGKAIMLLKTVYYDEQNQPMEYKLGFYHSDVFSFQAQRSI